jgi:hypothetical protein
MRDAVENPPAENLYDAPNVDVTEALWPRARRLAVLRRMLPREFGDIRIAWPDVWTHDNTGHRRLQRDLQALGATNEGGIWRLPREVRHA